MEKNYPKTAAVILAAGSGRRMGIDKTKQMLQICGKSVLLHSLIAFDFADAVSEIIVVCREDEVEFASAEAANVSKKVTVVKGGSTRAESAASGFYAISNDTEYVMIHDAARCLITPAEIMNVAIAGYKLGAATASRSVTDTVKRCDEVGKIIDTIPRNTLKLVQTPQMFSCKIYKNALNFTKVLDETITDDNMLVERLGVPIYCVETSSANIKITTSEDVFLAEYILNRRKENS